MPRPHDDNGRGRHSRVLSALRDQIYGGHHQVHLAAVLRRLYWRRWQSGPAVDRGGSDEDHSPCAGRNTLCEAAWFGYGNRFEWIRARNTRLAKWCKRNYPQSFDAKHGTVILEIDNHGKRVQCPG